MSASGPPTWNVTRGMRREPHWELNLASEDMQATVAEAEATVVPPGPKPGENSTPHTLRSLSVSGLLPPFGDPV